MAKNKKAEDHGASRRYVRTKRGLFLSDLERSIVRQALEAFHSEMEKSVNSGDIPATARLGLAATTEAARDILSRLDELDRG